ncbi:MULTISPECIES: large conductance mechanosensitive channel protein MscL [unclassified Fibrobacter]|uniref:large conductance mechanosensitive channel protein MscL n=1 Tax=unclassified Fibrobacter TaxID=2634177 RepID=UPI000D6D995E|nr:MULTISPECIES: large conductance mechanosensitive channel protein MscL [unclassified Fibrobacter]PWJ65576.1 large conductance mechanosensitive channel [Fibrobacter sp. UWR4]PZW72341.1 large conductance mechanosensitive channel [Fibrobacter sp. UWR1]
MGIKGKATSLLEEFKAFAFKGNIVDMAIGVIIGGAFGKIVTSFVNDIVMPGVTAIIAMGGGKDAGAGLKELVYTTEAGVAIPYGNFIGGIVDFLIVAIVVFLVMKKFLGFMQNMRKAEEAPAEPPAPPAPPEPSAEEKLLTEIRDLLKK